MKKYRTPTDEEWDAGVKKIIEQFEWDWSKHFPKRDPDSWRDLVNDFLIDFEDLKSNYDPDMGEPGSRNSEELAEFMTFCIKHPDLRFFQALSIWIGKPLYIMEENIDSSTGMGLPGKLHDTFGWEKESYERNS